MFSKTGGKWAGVATAILLLAGAFWAATSGALNALRGGTLPVPQFAKPSRNEEAARVAGIGWIQPEKGVIQVAAPAEAGRAPIIAHLSVKEGDSVKKGQVLAVLSNTQDLQAAIAQAEARVELMRRRLAQVHAGARAGDVGAVKAQLERLESERRDLRQTLSRQQALLEKDFIARVQVDATRSHVAAIESAMVETNQRLQAMSEVRDSDVQVAQAAVNEAESDLSRARALSAGGVVRAPQAGRVLKLNAQEGEVIGASGLLELAPTGPMIVLAEIYETDATRVRVGQQATLSGEILPHPITGTVAWISPAIRQRQSPSLDPAAFSEARVFTAKIAVADSDSLRNRINGKVNVLIEP